MGMTDFEKRTLKGSSPFLDVVAVSIPDASRVSGLSRSEIYRRLAAGDIRAVKSGSRTLILMDSLRAHLVNLRHVPRAEWCLNTTEPSTAAPGVADRETAPQHRADVARQAADGTAAWERQS
jgi:hypothetical protein